MLYVGGGRKGGGIAGYVHHRTLVMHQAAS